MCVSARPKGWLEGEAILNLQVMALRIGRMSSASKTMKHLEAIKKALQVVTVLKTIASGASENIFMA